MNLDSTAGTILIGAVVFALIGLLVFWVAGTRGAVVLGIREESPWFFRPAGARTQGLFVAYVAGLVAVGAFAYLAVSSVMPDSRTLPWTAAWVSAVVTLAGTMTRVGRRLTAEATEGRGLLDEPAQADFVTPDDALDDIDARAAREAALAGDWRPAAALLAATPDNDARFHRVEVLSAAALRRSAWLDSWLRERPDDPHALAVRAQLAMLRAWEVRGAEWTPRDPERFLDALADAETCAREAIAAAPTDPSPHVTLITAARGQQVDRAEFDRRLAALLALAPGLVAGHEQALQYLAPKWFGSTEEMLAFARDASARATPGSALALLVVLAHVEQHLILSMRPGRRAARYMAEPEVVADIAAAEARWRADDGPSPVRRAQGHNLLAYAWWLADDAAAAAPHLRETREHLSEFPWQYHGEPSDVHAQVQAWTRQRGVVPA